jgi:hypothetical protein
MANMVPNMEGYYVEEYPSKGLLYKNFGDDIYSFSIHAYCRSVKQGHTRITLCDMVYLRCYRDDEKSWIPVWELYISDCLSDHIRSIRMAMRFIDNRLIACVNNSYILLDATNPEELKIIDKQIDVLKRYLPLTYRDRKKELSIPLVPIEEISVEERIRLSIDLNYGFYNRDNRIYESSIVDVHDDKFAFFFVDLDDVVRFDVTRWDNEKVYCKFSGARPFTILEVMTESHHYHYHTFVKNGKLYSNLNNTLMVFDIRSNRRIRKLGHFVRMNYEIEDMAVLEDGNILLCVRLDQDQGLSTPNKQKNYLYLLKNPE